MPTILTKKSDTPGSIPATANLTNAAGGAELAVNTADKRLFTITSGSQVVELGTNPSSLTCADGSFTLLKAASASITNLTATSLVLSNLSIASANVTTLTSASATITNLLATSLTVSGNTFLATSSGNVGIGTSSPANKLQVVASTSGTNDLVTISRFDRATSGTAANGLGGRLEFSAQDNAGSQRTAAFINWGLASVASGSPTGFLSLSTRGTDPALYIDNSGNLGLGVTPSAWTTNFGIKALQVGPSSAIVGSNNNTNVAFNVYFDGTNERYISNGFASTYVQDSGKHIWSTAPSGTAGNAITSTTAMTLDASGRLGIGTSSPSTLLHLSSTLPIITFTDSDDSASSRVFQDSESFVIDVDNANAKASSTLKFNIDNTERARITSGGDFLVGTTSSTASARGEFFKSSGSTTLRVKSTIANAEAVYLSASNNDSRYADLGIYKHSGITNSSAYLALYKEDGGASYLWTGNDNNFRISTASGDIGTNGGTVVGTQTSDERVKNIVGPVQYGLNEVLALQPIAFAMKDTPETKKVGFSAQQVQAVIPEAVYDTGECIDGYDVDPENKMLQTPKSDRTKLAMEYTQIIPVLVNAVKELKAELDAAKAEIAALKGA